MSATNGSITLNFGAMQAAESQLSGNLSALRARLDQLTAELQPLVHTWSGDAQAAYVIQKRQWEQAADDMAAMLATIVTGLHTTTSDYAAAQRRIVAAFS